MRRFAIALVVLLGACQPGETPAGEPVAEATTATVPGDADDTAPYDGIGAGEVVHFTGTEPFWGGEVEGKTLTYTTPDNIDGEVIMVERFAGRGGISYSGLLNGAEFEMTVTPQACGDGMSEIDYPFTVTLMLGVERRDGCAWTDRQPRTNLEQL